MTVRAALLLAALALHPGGSFPTKDEPAPPYEASAPTDAGLRTLVREPESVRSPKRHRKFAVVKPLAPYPG